MTETTAPASAETDIVRLIDLVAVVQRSQRTEDANLFLSLFAEDAVWVNGAGRRLSGLDEISTFTRQVLVPGALAGGSVRYDVANVRFLSPDIAVTSVDQEYLTADERPQSPREQGRPTYIWARRDGDWRLVQGQNTGVVQTD